ncbi:MAG: gliding motility-associated C-terminal domain-containing protein [Chitinophagales bacterium]|nr:gliding motility-associated C-terminal domain-containing protein [Chitinophagales bacterium]
MLISFNNIYKAILLAIAMMASQAAYAQPDWAVTPSDFQYTMTVTGVGLFQCNETLDENDMIGAFVDDECRGVQQFSTLHEERQYAFLTIYDNLPAGATVTLKLYDASDDKITDAVFTLDFEENGVMGTLSDPYEFKTDYDLDQVILSNDLLYTDNSFAGSVVADVFAVNEIGDTLTYAIDFVMDTLGVDNDYFSIMDNQLVLEEDTDYANKKSYQIHLIVIAPNGCSQEGVFELTVINNNAVPTGLVKTDTTIEENMAIGSLVAPLIAIDSSVNDVHQFELIGEPEEWPDHEFFEIVGSELLSKVVFDYESREEYLLQIKITDRVGNIYVDTLPIYILDVIEFDDLKAANLVTPNDDGFNDFFEVPNVYLFENYELCIYNDNGNRVYVKKGNYENDWDGKNDNGKQLPNGTYFFILRDQTNEKNAFKGSIHLYLSNNY